LSEVRRQIVPDSPKFGARLPDEKPTSVSRAQFSWAGVGDETAVVSQGAWNVFKQRLVDHGGDLELDAFYRTGSQFSWRAENWGDTVSSPMIECPSPTERQHSGSTGGSARM